MNESVELVEKQALSLEDQRLKDEPVSVMMELLSIDLDLNSIATNRKETLCSVRLITSLMKISLFTIRFELPQCLQIYMPHYCSTAVDNYHMYLLVTW